MLVSDVDFQGNTILIREKKRTKGMTTTRRIPLAPFVGGVLKMWLALHPGGKNLFSQATVVRSKTKRTTAVLVTRDDAHDHFRRAVIASQKAILRPVTACKTGTAACIAPVNGTLAFAVFFRLGFRLWSRLRLSC
jgi:integrase